MSSHETQDHILQTERVLVVDDEFAVTDLLSRYLSKYGYTVDSASNGTEMFASIKKNEPDLILLDLELPGTHGLNLVKDLREKLQNVGIIIVSGTGVEVDMVVALEMGADDYIQKPFDQRPLLARVRSVLRRIDKRIPETTSHKVAHFADFKLDLTAHKLLNNSGIEISFTGHEFQLLEVFVKHAGRVMNRNQILDLINESGQISSDRSIDVLVSKLRKKLELNSSTPELIKTIRGIGYIMTAQVSFVD